MDSFAPFVASYKHDVCMSAFNVNNAAGFQIIQANINYYLLDPLTSLETKCTMIENISLSRKH